MREHQIVINLKREQFEEVQRLARLAGSKSVSAYLKERVLALVLKPEPEPEPPDGPTLEELLEVNHELSRMHRELQVFIAESLSNSIYSGDEELENEFDPDNFDQTFAAFQEMERNMEEEIERMKGSPDTSSGATSRAQQADTINNTPVDPYSMHGAQAFKRADTPRPGASHRNQSPSSKRSKSSAQSDFSEPGQDEEDYPVTGFPLESEDVLDASAEIPGMVDDEPIALPPTPGATVRTRSNQRIRIIPTQPLPSPEEQAAHWKAQQMPVSKQNEEPDSLNSTKEISKETAATTEDTGKPKNSDSMAAPINTGVPDALPPSDWSGHPVSNFVDSAGIYTSTAAESIWFTPPSQVLKPSLQPDNSLPEGASNNTTGSGISESGPEPSDSTHGGTLETNPSESDTTFDTNQDQGEEPRSQFAQPNDELEDLAERAFAISPRLGTFDTSPNAPAGIRKRQLPDPLDELIDESIMEEAQRLRASNQIQPSPYDDGVVYAFGGPENSKDSAPEDQYISQTKLPRMAQGDAADQQALLVGASDMADSETDSVPNMQTSAQSTSGSSPPVENEDSQIDHSVTPSEDYTSPQSTESDNLPTSSAPSPDPSVLGGPPPKRRRTMDDLSTGDDDEIISGGPPPKRRKK